MQRLVQRHLASEQRFWVTLRSAGITCTPFALTLERMTVLRYIVGEQWLDLPSKTLVNVLIPLLKAGLLGSE